nr:MAG TPA: hypothetical protein [Caudoviricetes sp.]
MISKQLIVYVVIIIYLFLSIGAHFLHFRFSIL